MLKKPSTGAGQGSKPEILLLNKIDTDTGRDEADFWRALHAGAIPISAKTGEGLGDLQEAVYQHVRGTQVDVTLEADVTNGRLLSFIESHTRVHDRQFLDGRIQLTRALQVTPLHAVLHANVTGIVFPIDKRRAAGNRLTHFEIH